MPPEEPTDAPPPDDSEDEEDETIGLGVGFFNLDRGLAGAALSDVDMGKGALSVTVTAGAETARCALREDEFGRDGEATALTCPSTIQHTDIESLMPVWARPGQTSVIFECERSDGSDEEISIWRCRSTAPVVVEQQPASGSRTFSGSGQGVRTVSLAPGRYLVTTSVSGNTERSRATNFAVWLRDRSGGGELLANEIANSWRGERAITVGGRFGLTAGTITVEVQYAAASARWTVRIEPIE